MGEGGQRPDEGSSSMLIPCPHCGTRPVEEFTFLGDANLVRPENLEDPSWQAYVYERDNPRGPIDEFAHHSGGCRAWLVVSRDTKTHAVFGAVIAKNFKRKPKS
jgi:methylglutamate dehydrogenase subunit B